jgi:cob(I)alamin adenosyltransferase
MWYTRKGDDGTTGSFGTKERMKKSSLRAEGLGSLDELNSWLGLVKVRSGSLGNLLDQSPEDIVHRLQSDLFIIQAELAGAEMTIAEEKIAWLELVVDTAEQEVPTLTGFSIAGGTELSALFDIARTQARKTERAVLRAVEDGHDIGAASKQYLNRLSSVLFALARLSNSRGGITERSPEYR